MRSMLSMASILLILAFVGSCAGSAGGTASDAGDAGEADAPAVIPDAGSDTPADPDTTAESDIPGDARKDAVGNDIGALDVPDTGDDTGESPDAVADSSGDAAAATDAGSDSGSVGDVGDTTSATPTCENANGECVANPGMCAADYGHLGHPDHVCETGLCCFPLETSPCGAEPPSFDCCTELATHRPACLNGELVCTTGEPCHEACVDLGGTCMISPGGCPDDYGHIGSSAHSCDTGFCCFPLESSPCGAEPPPVDCCTDMTSYRMTCLDGELVCESGEPCAVTCEDAGGECVANPGMCGDDYGHLGHPDHACVTGLCCFPLDTSPCGSSAPDFQCCTDLATHRPSCLVDELVCVTGDPCPL